MFTIDRSTALEERMRLMAVAKDRGATRISHRGRGLQEVGLVHHLLAGSDVEGIQGDE